uniref:Centrosomal protein 68 n=1 Tax=Lepisosteus oculatus TaxID=7918 RepID=W5NGJ8_LEPOC|nr:PREDICTED: centrosomal protein of 68 kDa [Lepisosteus oculatus]
MALEAGRYPMEPKSYGRLEKAIPKLVYNARPHRTTADTVPRIASSRNGPGLPLDLRRRVSEKTSQKKSSAIIPSCRYSTGKANYAMRKPLFDTSAAYTKTTSHANGKLFQSHLEQEGQAEDERAQCTRQTFEFRLKSPAEEFEDIVAVLSDQDCSTDSQSEDVTAPLSALCLKEWRPPHEETSFYQEGSLSRPHRRCASSPPLDVRSLRTKGSSRGAAAPRASSLDTHIPSSRLSRRRGPQVCQALSASSLPLPRRGALAFREMSPYQADYWACAIPSSLPPSPNRDSPGWDPNEEYQNLLDYTYPLKPKHLVSRDASDCRLFASDPLMRDSGIELDHFSSPADNAETSTNSELLGHRFSVRESVGSGRERTFSSKALKPASPCRKELSSSKADFKMSSSWYSSMDQVDLSLENSYSSSAWQEMHSSKNVDYKARHARHGIFSSPEVQPTYIPTSHILPPDKGWDSDDEFCPLPFRLKELEVLSQQLQTISIQVNKPVDARWESPSSLGRETFSIKSSTALLETKVKEGSAAEEPSASDFPCSARGSREGQELGTGLHRLGSDVTKRSLRRAAMFVTQLGGLPLSEFQKTEQADRGQTEAKESLVRHVQMFCMNLEELIQWLYKVVEKVDSWNPPAADIESIKTSLADYKRFQRDVDAQQPLTAAVLKAGGVLLSCMNSTSPVLKETLGLIERQSKALEVQAELLFSSILSAVDRVAKTEAEHSEDSSTDLQQSQQLNESGFVEQD